MQYSQSLGQYIVLLLLIFTQKSVFAAEATVLPPKYEMRAVWLTTIGGLDWPHTYANTNITIKQQKKELCKILDSLKSANINTILLQTRIRGTVIYPSVYEPWDGCLSGIPGQSPGYDALKFAIEECHKRGMELHAWIVTIPLGKWNKIGCKNIRTRHSKIIKKIGAEGYMNPACEETANYLSNICSEIACKYDVDGIHLDYIRYPETWKPVPTSDDGRRHITRIIQKIFNSVKKEKPWIKLSCSPIGKFKDLSRYSSHGWNAFTKVFQDAQGWLHTGIIDAVFPMMYFQGNQFYPFALDWKENSNGRIVSVGLGIYFLSEKEKNWNINIIKRQMNVLRNHGLGHTFFRSKFFTDNIKGIYDYTKDNIDCYPALIPPMKWQSITKPQAPTSISVIRQAEKDKLLWNKTPDASGGLYHRYNIYASTDYPVNINDTRNLLISYLRDTSVNIPIHQPDVCMNYAVTAIDRYGNESKPVYTSAIVSDNTSQQYLVNDGYKLKLPQNEKILDADYVIFETLQGGIIDIRPYNCIYADISKLPEGMYVLRSLNKKGITHRIGLFCIRRKT